MNASGALFSMPSRTAISLAQSGKDLRIRESISATDQTRCEIAVRAGIEKRAPEAFIPTFPVPFSQPPTYVRVRRQLKFRQLSPEPSVLLDRRRMPKDCSGLVKCGHSRRDLAPSRRRISTG